MPPLFSYACALFHFPYTTESPPSSLLSIPSALFPKYTGVCTNSSQSGTPTLSSTNHKSGITRHHSQAALPLDIHTPSAKIRASDHATENTLRKNLGVPSRSRRARKARPHLHRPPPHPRRHLASSLRRPAR